MSIFRSLVDDMGAALGGAKAGVGGGFRAAIDGFGKALPPKVGGTPPAPSPVPTAWGYTPPRIGSPLGVNGGIAGLFSQRFGGTGTDFGGGGYRPPTLTRPAAPVATAPKTTPSAGAGAVDGLGSSKWADLINQEAAQYSNPELAEVAQAVVQLESKGDENAQGVVVTQGAYAGQRAQGLGQIMPGNYPGVNLLDPRTNVQKMLEMLWSRFQKYGNWDSVVASYFGAVDAQGRPTTQADDNGTTGVQYVATVNQHRQAIRAAQRPPGVGGTAYTTRTGIKNLDYAIQNYLGTPYTNGGIRQSGNPLDGMDCSSFSGYALGLDRGLWNAQAQYDHTQRVAQGAMQVGDLVFFQGTTGDDPSAKPVTHVGVYLGGGKMIHTGGEGGLMIVDLNTQYWQQHYYGSGRVKR